MRRMAKKGKGKSVSEPQGKTAAAVQEKNKASEKPASPPKPTTEARAAAIKPKAEPAKVEPEKIETPRSELPKIEPVKIDPAKTLPPKGQTPKPATPAPAAPPVQTPEPGRSYTQPPPGISPPLPAPRPQVMSAPLPPPEERPPVTPHREPIHMPQSALMFEIAWEVCWQLGGIYTVLKTKAQQMLERWGDRYCLIGPYNPATAAIDFEERPTEGVIRQTLDKLRGMGIPCHYGRWLIPGRPRVILLDYRARFWSLDSDKYLMWKDHGISCPPNDGEVNEVVAFGFTVAEFFRELTALVQDRPVLAHFHEWMGGVAVPRIAHTRIPVTTVFTTHATLLGRYLAGDNPQFYEHLPFFNADAEASKYQILARHQIEKAGAHASTVFTTVSDVTALEAEKLLGRKPDVILPNGINIQRFQAMHEFQNLHAKLKEKIHEFTTGHFFPSYTFDLDKTLYFFTSGRYEYRNKGIDLFIESLARLNDRLRPLADRPTIVAFIVTRAPTRNINVGTLQSQAMFNELRNTCKEIETQMGKKLLQASVNGRIPQIQELIPEDAQVRLKRAMHVWRSTRWPSIVTHDLQDDAGDAVLKHLRFRRMFNSADDPVKVVFHPEFLTSTSPLISLDYDHFVRGCHMGIFPSYYEPWGYTPLESIALGVPAVTTDLSGFGAYVERNVYQHEENGVHVLQRRDRGFDQAAESLAQHMFSFCRMSRRQRIELRNRVERLSEMFDWSALIRHYHEAHDLALERVYGKRPGKFELRIV
jgi:glycogen(starch) synthase